MGVSTNSEDHNHNRMIITLNILSLQECDQDRQELEEQNQSGFDNNIVPVIATPPSSPELKQLKILSPYEVQEKNDNDDGFKTPTSLDHKIPPMLECPGAPRKKMMKRRLVFDLSREVKSMFTISFMEDLKSVKNKKLKSSMLIN